jgi:hypothetical protein
MGRHCVGDTIVSTSAGFSTYVFADTKIVELTGPDLLADMEGFGPLTSQT